MPRRSSTPETSSSPRQQDRDENLHNAINAKFKAEQKLKETEKKNEELLKEVDHLSVEVEQNQRRIVEADNMNRGSKAVDLLMNDMEIRNSSLEARLRDEEKARRELDIAIRQMTEEISSLRAKEVILNSVEKENDGLKKERRNLEDDIRRLEAAMQVAKRKHEQQLLATEELVHNHEIEVNSKQKEHNDLLRQIKEIESNFSEQSKELEACTKETNEYKAKCQDTNYKNQELATSMQNYKGMAEKYAEVNDKLIEAKDTLHAQVQELTEKLRGASLSNNELSREVSTLSHEKELLASRLVEVEGEKDNLNEDNQQLNYMIAKARELNTGYETGVVRSKIVEKELEEARHSTENVRKQMEIKVDDLVGRVVAQEAAMVNYEKRTRKFKSELVESESKVEYFKDNYLSKDELLRAKHELEIKYKVDLHSQMEKLSAIYADANSVRSVCKPSIKNECDFN